MRKKQFRLQLNQQLKKSQKSELFLSKSHNIKMI